MVLVWVIFRVPCGVCGLKVAWEPVEWVAVGAAVCR